MIVQTKNKNKYYFSSNKIAVRYNVGTLSVGYKF